MRLLLCFLAVGFALFAGSASSEEVAKRSVWRFASMIAKATGRGAWQYTHYGCWCGLGGKGNPVDAVDRCCVCHDVCYNKLIDRGICNKSRIYLVNYYFTGSSYPRCLRKKTSGFWRWKKTVNVSRCGYEKCKCDAAAVVCFRRNWFNKKYRLYNKNKCSKSAALAKYVKQNTRC